MSMSEFANKKKMVLLEKKLIQLLNISQENLRVSVIDNSIFEKNYKIFEDEVIYEILDYKLVVWKTNNNYEGKIYVISDKNNISTTLYEAIYKLEYNNLKNKQKEITVPISYQQHYLINIVKSECHIDNTLLMKKALDCLILKYHSIK